MGMIILINENFWRKTEAEKAAQKVGKRTKKYMAIHPLEENYHICEVLKKCGYKILFSADLVQKTNNGSFEVFHKSFLKERNFVESLENILNMSTVLEFYKNSDPELF